MRLKRILFYLPVLLAVPLLLAPGPFKDKELGYRRITMQKRIDEFYKTCGKNFLNKNVHILIPASVFRKKPYIVRRPNLVYWYRYENRSVPIICNPKNIYLKRLNSTFDKEKKRKRNNRKVQTVSVFGSVYQPTWDIKGRSYIMLHKMKTYGGALKKSVD